MKTWLKWQLLNLKYNAAKLKYRFLSLKKILRILLILALVIILGISLLPLSKRSLPGYDFLLRISYAYLTSLIFYFIVVHSPKEDKKQNLYLVINNRTFDIHWEINELYKSILGKNQIEYKPSDPLMPKEEFYKLCDNIQYRESVTVTTSDLYNINFNNYFSLFAHISKVVKSNYTELIHFYDFLTPIYLESLGRLYEEFQRRPFNGQEISNRTLTGISLYHIIEETKILMYEARAFKKWQHQEYIYKLKIKNFKG
jgi:hypothetical protein